MATLSSLLESCHNLKFFTGELGQPEVLYWRIVATLSSLLESCHNLKFFTREL